MDRLEDLTHAEDIRLNAKCDRTVALYGYVRGSCLKRGSGVHLPGCGDLTAADVNFLPDPCPLPDMLKKLKRRRSLQEKEKCIYAPMAGVGGIVYDKDAVYIDLGGSHSHRNNKEEDIMEPSNELVKTIISAEKTLDEKMDESEVRLFAGAEPMKHEEDSRQRRKVVFDNELSENDSDAEDSTDDEANMSDGESASESDQDEQVNVSKNGNVDHDESESEPQDEDSRVNRDEEPPKKKRTLANTNKFILKELGVDSDEEENVEEEELSEVEALESHEEEKPTDELQEKSPKKAKDLKKHQKMNQLNEKNNLAKVKVVNALAVFERKSNDDKELPDDSSDDNEEDASASEEEGSEVESEEDDEVESAKLWKQDRMKQAAEAFYHRASNPQSLRR